jgi:putative flippase GtrA
MKAASHHRSSELVVRNVVVRNVVGPRSLQFVEITPSLSSERPMPMLARWLKFNLVGAAGIFAQLAVLSLLKSALRMNYLAATAIAVEIAVLHNFVWHEKFTWIDRSPSNARSAASRRVVRRLLRFHLANGAVSILGNLALMKVMVGRGHMNYLVANSIAIVLCSVVNFIASDRWVFDA